MLEGKYRLQREVGAGGMGQVFLARHETIERTVAIKVLHQELANDESVRRRFKTEAKAIGRLRHQNCVMLYEFGFSDEIEALFAVFEYVEGRSLEEWVGKQLPIGDVIELGKQVADGMDHAHTQKIIHRDLKPENIMVVDADGRPEIKILDFGIARLAEDDKKRTRLTQVGQMFGTPPYMSPEQVRAQLNVTFSTDIYAIGVILYEMLEGKLPFLGDTPIETVMMHLNDEVPPMKRQGVPEELEDIVMRCLQKDPAHRFESCAALQRALTDLNWTAKQPSVLGTTGSATGGGREADATDVDSPPKPEQSEGTETSGSQGEQSEAPEDRPAEEEIASAPTIVPNEDEDQQQKSGEEPEKASTTHDLDDSSDEDRINTLAPVGQRKTRVVFAAIALVVLLTLGGLTAVVLLSGGDDEELGEEQAEEIAEIEPDASEQDQGEDFGAADEVDDEPLAAGDEEEEKDRQEEESLGADEDAGEEDEQVPQEEEAPGEAAPAQQADPAPTPDPQPEPEPAPQPEPEQEEESQQESASDEPEGPTGIGLDRRRRGGDDDEDDESISDEEQADEPQGIDLPGRD